jgi:gluconate 2-dehydrogenase alpha chain
MTDVALIGLGGAGGIAAQVLTEAGLEVTALEAGPRLAPAAMALDELRNDVHEWLAAPKAHGEQPTWRSDATAAAGPSPWPMLMVNAVGGSTVHYPGLSARLAPWDFRARSAVVERYGASAVPRDSTLADWPLRYDDLEEDYDWVEQAIGVAGSDAASPFAGPRRRPYPMPELRRSGWNRLTAEAAEALGWHPFPAPAAINSVPYNGNPECTFCGFCSCNGCYRDAKGSTDATVIRRAQATGRLRVQTGTRVVRIDVDRDGLARGVTYVGDGRERFLPACVVLLATYTYENTRLLLLSPSPAHPRGLANGSGQVGRHYMAHVTPFVFGSFGERRLHLWNGLWAQATCVEDWSADNFDHAGLGFIGGGLCTAAQEVKPIALASVPPPPGVARWGAEWKRWLARAAPSIGIANAQLATLPYEGNRLDLDPAVRDPHGAPVVRVTFSPGDNERRGSAFLAERLHEWLRAAGAEQTWAPPGLVIEPRHAYGGTRMGDDPAGSVVDRHGFCHEVPNLGVLGASTFPTAGGVNPTLTVQALARRTARHLVQEWDRRGGPAAATAMR